MSDCLLKPDWEPDFRLWHATSFRCDAKADAIRAKRTFRGWRERANLSKMTQSDIHPIAKWPPSLVSERNDY
jgi:hypothetical protein